MARCMRPIDLLKQRDPYCFTPGTERTIRSILQEFRAPYILVYPDFDEAIDGSRLLCTAMLPKVDLELRSNGSNLIVRFAP